MKPDAWMRAQWGVEHLIFTAVKPSEEIAWEPLYSAAKIRKWLSECTEEMWQVGMNTEGGTDDKYRAMIAARIAELEVKK